MMQARPALLVKLLIVHDAFDYGVGVIACQIDHDMFRPKLLDTWNVWAVEEMRLDVNFA